MKTENEDYETHPISVPIQSEGLNGLSVVLRHWYVVAITLVCVLIYTTFVGLEKLRLHSAEVILDISNYEILYKPSLLFPVDQHRALAKGPEIKESIAKEWLASGYIADARVIDDCIGVDDLGDESNLIRLKVVMDSASNAEAAMKIWLNMLEEQLPKYRAAYLAKKMGREMALKEQNIREKKDLLAHMEMEQRSFLIPNGSSELTKQAIQKVIMDLHGQIFFEDASLRPGLALVRELDQLSGGEHSISILQEEKKSDMINQHDAALDLVTTGLKQVVKGTISLGQSHDPRELPFRVITAGLTAVLFACTMIVFLDWIIKNRV